MRSTCLAFLSLRSILLPEFFRAAEVSLLESLKDHDISLIPIRATIISAVFVVPYVVNFRILQSVDIDVDVKAVIIRGVIAVILAVRCPLTAFVTFKSAKEVATNKQRIKERRERQEVEIRNALLKRHNQRKLGAV